MKSMGTLQGKGTLHFITGRKVQVTYSLTVRQDEIDAGTLDDPKGTIPGPVSITGEIHPAFYGEQGLILETQEELLLSVRFLSPEGRVNALPSHT